MSKTGYPKSKCSNLACHLNLYKNLGFLNRFCVGWRTSRRVGCYLTIIQVLCAPKQNGWKSQQSDFQHSSHLTSTQVYIPCRYWQRCTSYSSPDISCKCWNLKNTGAAGYPRRLIGGRSGDAFEIKMGAEEQDNDEEPTKGWEWKWKPGRRKAGGEEEKWAGDGAGEQSRRTKGHKEEMAKEMGRAIS